MAGVINRCIAENYLLNKWSGDEVMEYIHNRGNLSLEIRKDETSKTVWVTNTHWVNKTHMIVSYVASQWSDHEIINDCARKVANKLGLRKVVRIEETY